jgi:hypothetical protein
MQGTTAWGDLDVGSLQRGSEELEKKARKEKELKDHATFRAVETRMYNFKVMNTDCTATCQQALRL